MHLLRESSESKATVALPPKREKHLCGRETKSKQCGADNGADEGAVCEEEYLDYVGRSRGSNQLGGADEAGIIPLALF
jgi:hypothetical protein